MNHLDTTLKAMHHEIRVPSKEPFGYVNVSFFGTPEEAIAEQIRLSKVAQGEDVAGLFEKVWNACLDSYLTDKGITADQWEGMNRQQQFVINQI